MQINQQNQLNLQQKKIQEDVYSYPLPVRLKHASWSVRKGTYEQILFLLQSISDVNQQITISGNIFTVESLLPYFQFLIQQKHAGVLLKGLQCVQQILKIDKKATSKHCIKSLADKGIQYFPLLSQQRKAILQKFLDILEMSKIEPNFLKNKLSLPHQKSVMYVIQVIGVLNMVSLKSALLNTSKKHPKKCVRQLALQIAQQLDPQNEQKQSQKFGQQVTPSGQSNSIKNAPKTSKSNNSSACKITIEKLPHYQQLNSKKQQQFSSQVLQRINQIINEYTLAQLPNFSHFLRLMIDDNNHIINTNAIKCLIAIFNKQKQQGFNKNSLLPLSFPLLFLFSKFKSHKTHPINSLLLSLAQQIIQSPANRVNDLFLAINQGLSSMGSKANVKFGCALTFFRIMSLIYHNQDLYNCTKNQNIQTQNQDLQQKFKQFSQINLGKNIQKIIQKIFLVLEKDKKYQTQIYLIKHGIGLDFNGNNIVKSSSEHDLVVKNNKSQTVNKKNNQNNQKNSNKLGEYNSNSSNTKSNKQLVSQQSNQKPLKSTSKSNSVHSNSNSISLSKTLKNTKSSTKFQQINLESTLNQIIKLLNKHNQYQQKKAYFNSINNLLQKSSQQFYQSVRQKRYEMFYLCELIQNFIQHYEPQDSTIEMISEFLINILKIVSLLKPNQLVNNQSNVQFGQSSNNNMKKVKEISRNNVQELLLVALCRLVISEQIQQILQNLMQNYDYQIVFQALENLFVKNRDNKIKKKNKKYLLEWLESNTPALFLNNDYYKLVQKIQQKKTKKVEQPQKQKQTQPQSPKSNKTHNRLKHLQEYENSSNNRKKQYQSHQSQLSSPNRKQNYLSYELQKLNLSKIQQKGAQSNFYDDMQKSSFHQNLQEHLKHFATQRSQMEDDMFDNRKQKDLSRQYLKKIEMQSFKKKVQNQNILQSSPFKQQRFKQEQKNFKKQSLREKLFKRKQYNQEQQGQQQEQQNYQEKRQQLNNEQQITDLSYKQKFDQVQQRRLQRQKQRRQFMNRMKYQFKPLNRSIQDEGEQQEQNQQQDYIKFKENKMTQQRNYKQQLDSNNSEKDPNQETQQIQKQVFDSNRSQRDEKEQQEYVKYQDVSKINSSNIFQSNKQTISQANQQPIENKQQSLYKQSNLQNSVDKSFVSSTQSCEFKYRLINSQKMIYMLKSTNNPYPHLRTLILIPFKSSVKKHQFLKQLLHFFSNHVEFKIPQPYNSLILLTILLFSQIKQDKTLIQPLQSLYEFVAKQSTTNEFIKTLINLFHSVIEQTLPQNRKFLITILLKSMIRMLPFIQDGVSLLRDIQQFYQIGQMVYFQMFQDEYKQIKAYIQEQAINIIIQKALQQQSDNLKTIVEGWLTTGFKTKVLEVIEQYENDNQEQQQHHESQTNYKSFI